MVPGGDGEVFTEPQWAQRFFFAKLGEPVTGGLTSSASTLLQEIEPDRYYEHVGYAVGLLQPGADRNCEIAT